MHSAEPDIVLAANITEPRRPSELRDRYKDQQWVATGNTSNSIRSGPNNLEPIISSNPSRPHSEIQTIDERS